MGALLSVIIIDENNPRELQEVHGQFMTATIVLAVLAAVWLTFMIIWYASFDRYQGRQVKKFLTQFALRTVNNRALPWSLEET